MTTYKELQELNRQRQTGQQYFEIPPPPKRTMGSDGQIVETPISPDNEILTGRDFFGRMNLSNVNYTEQAEQMGYGQSKYDTRSGFQPDVNIEDIRAREQSWGSKVLNGTLKGALTAGTVYANTTAGFAAGIATALYGFTPFGQMQQNGLAAVSPFSKKQDLPELGEAIQAGANNVVSQKLIALQQLGEELFPNYRTEYEQSDKYQREWYKPRNLVSGNTIGDMFLKNFGFIVGAMLGMGTWQKALGKKAASELAKDTMAGAAIASEGDAAAIEGMKGAAEAIKRGGVFANGKAIADNVRNVAKSTATFPFLKQVEFGMISAMGEGNAEGLMARDEYLEEAVPRLDQWFQEQYDSLEEQVKNASPDNREKVNVPDGNGGYVEDYVLSGAGQEALLARQNMLFDEYRKRRQMLDDEADEMAATVFGLNIPILTVSTMAQFSKLLGGGWRSARKAAGKAVGRMAFDAAGNPVAKYAEKGAVRGIAKGIAGTSKVALSEAGEEMAQGFVSSGAKNVADARMTSYNDLGYDRKSLDFFRDEWLQTLAQGGRDYLGDTKNWQEGFLGAITGLIGMPGRGYFRGERGGIAEGIADARNEMRESYQAGAKLNQLVNTKDFQDRWKGYIRHLAFDDNIKNAVDKDDEYLFHWADDGQLFNDVMTFAKAGRLDDLIAVADRFSNLSQQDIQDVREQLKQGQEPNTDRDSDIKDRVEKQAAKIKKTVNDYARIREETLARLPMNASEDIVDEAVFTGMQIQAAEERFVDLLNQTLGVLDGALEASSKNKKGSEEYKQELEELKTKYTKIFAGSLLPVDAQTRKADEEELKKLDSLVSGNDELKKKVDDMKKLYRDRQNFFEKYTKLQKTTNEEFAAQAQNQQKVVQKALAQELQSYKSLGEIRDEYRRRFESEEPTSGFIDEIRSVRKTNPAADDFMKLWDAFNGVRGAIVRKIGGFPSPADPRIRLMNEMLYRANDVDQLLNDPDTVMSYDDEDWGMTREDFDNGPRQFVLDAIREFANTHRKVAGRENIQQPAQTEANAPAATSGGMDPSAPASVVPDAPDGVVENPVSAQEELPPAPVPEVSKDISEVEQDKQERNMSEASEPDLLESAFIADQGVTIQEIDAYDETGDDGGKNYYQTAIPEITLDDANVIRDAAGIADPKMRKEKLKDTGKSFVEKKPGFQKVWDYLVDNDAFNNTINLKNRAKVKFMAEPGLEFNGKPIIIMFTEENGQRKILNVMRSPNGKTSYQNLGKFWSDFEAQWKKAKANNPNEVFVFKDKNGNDMESTVWNKRFGVIDYDYNYNENTGKYQNEKPVQKVDAYNPNAPIFWIDQDGHISYLRGEKQGRERKINMGRHPQEWLNNHRGAMYYLAEDGTGKLMPIRLWLEHFRPSNMNDKNKTFDSIRETLGNIQAISKNFFARVNPINNLSQEERDKIRDEENAKMHAEFANLKGKLNVSHLFFSFLFDKNGIPMLHVTTNYREGKQQKPDEFNGFFMVPDNLTGSSKSSYISNLTNRIAELGLSVDAKKGYQNKSEISNFNELMEEGLITTNARKMLPKNVDFYIEPYVSLEEGFQMSGKQQAVLEETAPAPEAVSEEDPFAYMDEGDAGIDFENEDFGAQESEMPAQSSDANEDDFVKNNRTLAESIVESAGDQNMFGGINTKAASEAILLVAQKGPERVVSTASNVRSYNETNDIQRATLLFANILNSVMTKEEQGKLLGHYIMAIHQDFHDWSVDGGSRLGLSEYFERAQYLIDSNLDSLNMIGEVFSAQPNAEFNPQGEMPMSMLLKFDGLTEQQQTALKNVGITAEEFDEWNPMIQEDKLTCLGV